MNAETPSIVDALALLIEGSIQRGGDGVVVLSEYPFELDYL